MGVVQATFGRRPERRPTLVTVFGVQSYWRDRDHLVPGRFEQFANIEAALRAGKFAANRSAAVRVFRIRGNVEADYWEPPVTIALLGEGRDELRPPKPVVIASFGEVPEVTT